MPIDPTPRSDTAIESLPAGSEPQGRRPQQQSDSSDRPAVQQQQGQRQQQDDSRQPLPPQGNSRVDSAPDAQDPDVEDTELRRERPV